MGVCTFESAHKAHKGSATFEGRCGRSTLSIAVHGDMETLKSQFISIGLLEMGPLFKGFWLVWNTQGTYADVPGNDV